MAQKIALSAVTGGWSQGRPIMGGSSGSILAKSSEHGRRRAFAGNVRKYLPAHPPPTTMRLELLRHYAQ